MKLIEKYFSGSAHRSFGSGYTSSYQHNLTNDMYETSIYMMGSWIASRLSVCDRVGVPTDRLRETTGKDAASGMEIPECCDHRLSTKDSGRYEAEPS